MSNNMNQNHPFWEWVSSMQQPGAENNFANRPGGPSNNRGPPQDFNDFFGWGNAGPWGPMPHRGRPGPPPPAPHHERPPPPAGPHGRPPHPPPGHQGEHPPPPPGPHGEHPPPPPFEEHEPVDPPSRAPTPPTPPESVPGEDQPWGPPGPEARHRGPGHHHHGPRGPHGHPHGRRGSPGPRGRCGGRGGRRGPWGGRGPSGLPFDASNFDMNHIPEFLSTLFGPNGLDLSKLNKNAASRAAGGDGTFQPSIDVFSTQKAYIVHASLPGAKKSDLDVSWNASAGSLHISGVVTRPKEVDEELLSMMAVDERQIGLFERDVRLGEDRVDADGITAKLEDGVLRIEVPKVEEWTEVRKVDIE